MDLHRIQCLCDPLVFSQAFASGVDPAQARYLLRHGAFDTVRDSVKYGHTRLCLLTVICALFFFPPTLCGSLCPRHGIHRQA